MIKMKTSKILILTLTAVILAGCTSFLDRKPLTSKNDTNYWTSENSARLFANGFYERYFPGYNSGWGTAYAPMRGYHFNDDVISTAKQEIFENSVPASRGSASESAGWMANYGGPTWTFAWVRKANYMLDGVERLKSSGAVTDEAYNHWSAVARFFRGAEYSMLVEVFGDVPYYDHVLGDNETDELYKDRQDRAVVMDEVAKDFRYVLENMRVNDGAAQYLNRYIAAAFISRYMLFEGTWQIYHENNAAKAKEYLELARDAAEVVMSSNKYEFTSDYRSLFASDDLSSNKEVILFRKYDAKIGVYHHVASYSNLAESQVQGANLSFLKSLICTDGKTYSESTLEGADEFDITNLIKTRDSRFEASFYHEPQTTSSTWLYCTKFCNREVEPLFERDGGNTNYPDAYKSNTNTGDAPVIRYAEVVLNWIEAKAELAEMGGTAITQEDLNKSINAIRQRPLAPEAVERGVQQTAALTLGQYPNDPEKPADISSLIWEIRRERRMEFFFEFSRLSDLRRWKMLDQMSGAVNKDLLLGMWVNIPIEMPELLEGESGESLKSKLRIKNAAGEIITFDGTNQSEMVGFYIPENISDRDAFNERCYLAPVGEAQINQYLEKGYKLTQTELW